MKDINKQARDIYTRIKEKGLEELADFLFAKGDFDALNKLLEAVYVEVEDSWANSKEFKEIPTFADHDDFADEEDDFAWEFFGNFIINPQGKVVTYLPDFEDPVVVKTHPDDEFDKYVGAALAYAYSMFGSKTKFRKFVDENSKVLKSHEERKEDRKKHKKVAVCKKRGRPAKKVSD